MPGPEDSQAAAKEAVDNEIKIMKDQLDRKHKELLQKLEKGKDNEILSAVSVLTESVRDLTGRVEALEREKSKSDDDVS